MARKKIPDIPEPLPTTAKYDPKYDSILHTWGKALAEWSSSSSSKVTIEKGNVTGLPPQQKASLTDEYVGKMKAMIASGASPEYAYNALKYQIEWEEYKAREAAQKRSIAEKLELKAFHPSEKQAYKYFPIPSGKSDKYSRPIVVFDIETGGDEEVISLAALKMSYNKTSKRFELLDTYERAYYANQYTGSEWNKRYLTHGITKAATEQIRREQGAKYSEKYNADEQIAFREWIGDPNALLVGHNTEEFDIRYALGNDIGSWGSLDTLIAMENERGRGGNKLHQVFKDLTGKTMEDVGLYHHQAISDVIATAIILNFLAKRQDKVGTDIRDVLYHPGLSLAPKNEYINSQVVQGTFKSYLRDMTSYVLPGEIQHMDEFTEPISSMIPNAGELIDATKAGLTSVDDTTKKRQLASGFSSKPMTQETADKAQEDIVSALEAAKDAAAGVAGVASPEFLSAVKEFKKSTTEMTGIMREIQKSAASLNYSQRGAIVSRLSQHVDLSEPLFRPELESMQNWIAMADYLKVPEQERIRAYKASYLTALHRNQSIEEQDIASGLIKVNLSERAGDINAIQAKELRERVKGGESIPIIAQDLKRYVAGNNLEYRLSIAREKGELTNEQVDWLREGFNNAGWTNAQTKANMQREIFHNKQEELLGKEERKQSLREQAIGYMKSLSPWEKAGLLTKGQVKALGREALAEDWTVEKGDTRRQEAIRDKELKDKLWRSERIKEAVKSGRITARQGEKIEEAVVVNEQLAGAIEKAAQATKNWMTVLQALSQIPVFNPERIHNAYASGLDSVFGAAKGLIPKPILGIGTRLSNAAMANDLAKMQYFRATDKTLTALSPITSAGFSALGAAIGSAVPGLGTVAGAYLGAQVPGAVKGVFNAGTQVWGNYKEAGITKMFQETTMRLNVFGAMLDFVTLPLTALAKATKLLKGSFIGLISTLGRFTLRGIDDMSRLGNPLTHLTGINYSGYQQLQTQDTFFGFAEGSLNAYEEDFKRQAELLYNSGQYDQKRLVNASRLGLFNEVYGPQASFESTVNSLLKRDLTPSEMSLLQAINPNLAPTYELLKKAGATDMASYFNSAKGGIQLHGLSDAQQVSFKRDVYQKNLITKDMSNSWMIIADKIWTNFGKDTMNSLKETLHAIATSGTWRDAWDELKKGFKTIWDSIDFNAVKEVTSDIWTAFKTNILGMSEDQSFRTSIKTKMVDIVDALIDVWVSGALTLVDKVAPIISDFINWFNTIELHPKEWLEGKGDLVTFATPISDSGKSLKETGITNLRIYNGDTDLWRMTGTGKEALSSVDTQADILAGASGGKAMMEFYHKGKKVVIPASQWEEYKKHPWKTGFEGTDHSGTIKDMAGNIITASGEATKITVDSLSEVIDKGLIPAIKMSLPDVKGKLEVILKDERTNKVYNSTVDLSSKQSDNTHNMNQSLLYIGNGGR